MFGRNSTKGQVFMVFKCPSCSEVHQLFVAPLDEHYNAVGVGLELISIYTEQARFSECGLMIHCGNSDGNFLIAMERNGDTLTGTCKKVTDEELESLSTVPKAYALAAHRGLALDSQPANHGGAALMLINALETEKLITKTVSRLLKDVEVDL